MRNTVRRRGRADRHRALPGRRGGRRPRRRPRRAGRERAREDGASAAVVARIEDRTEPVYGVSTGFGSLANVAIPPDRREELQRALVRSHAAGMGPPVEREVVRAMMLLRARTLAMGYSGARPDGRRDDPRAAQRRHHAGRPRARLARRQRRPRAARPLRAGADRRGRGRRRGRRAAARGADALRAAGIEPLTLHAKEGLALINGTDGMLGMLVLALARPAPAAAGRRRRPRRCRSRRCSAPTAPSPRTWSRCARSRARRRARRTCGACSPARRSSPATAGTTTACRTPTRCAARRRSTAPRATRSPTPRRSPPRSSPRRSTTRWCCPTAASSRAATSTARRSASRCDFLAIAVAEVGGIAERRTDRLLDAARSHGLPPFLTPDAGVNSGLMIAQYTQAAMVAENRRLAAPASVDSLPTSAMQEDHVSMGWAAARKLRDRAAQPRPHPRGRADLRGARRSTCARRCTPAAGTAPRSPRARERIAGPGPDRWLAPELAAAEELVAGGALQAASRRPWGRWHEQPRWSARHAAPSCRAGLAAGGRAAHADEQPRPRGRRAPRGPRRLRRHRPRRAVVGGVRRDRPHADDPRRRRDAARAVRQAGRRDAHARVGAARADRELQPRARLGHLGRVPPARGPRADDVRPDDRGVVDLHRHAGDPAGHLRVLRRDRAPALRRLARRDDHADRRPRRDGRRAAAGGHDERRRRAVRRGRPAPDPSAGSRRATSTRWPTASTTRSRAAAPRRPSGAR